MALEFDHLGPGDYDRAKRVLNRAKHPGFVGREYYRCATRGMAVVARDGIDDLGVALVEKGKLGALSVVHAAQGNGVGTALIARTVPKWVNAIMDRVPWFERLGYKCVGSPKVGQSGKMATQLMELAGEVTAGTGQSSDRSVAAAPSVVAPPPPIPLPPKRRPWYMPHG